MNTINAIPGSDDLDDMTIHEPTRPSPEAIAAAVSREFSVPLATTFDWLASLNFKTAQIQWSNGA